MQKAYARINWENEPSTNTPLNETNLNKVDLGLDTVDDRIILFDTTKANQTDLLQSIKNVTYNSTTGVFVFTWWNGTTLTADLNIEKIPVSFRMSPQGIITMTTADGTVYTCDVASLIKTYTFTSGDVILFTTTTDSSGNKTVTATIADGSVTEEMLEVDFLANCRLAQANAEAAATSSNNYSLVSEGWAKGTQEDTDVTSGSPYYHNNSEYFKDQASASATAAASSETNAATSEANASNSASSASASASSASTSATNAATSETNASNSASSASTSATNAATSETNASNSASSASTSATNASASATLAESYAKGGTGTRQGENTDNAKYYKEVAEAAIGSGIATTEHVGLVKPDGDTIVIDSDGTIHGTETYVLPTATPTTLGGVKPDGTSILVSSDGTISTSSSAPEASDVEYDNTTSGLTADNAQDAIDELASEKQDASTAITTANIGSQSVNYANTAGSATSATTATTATSATTATKATQDGNGNNIVNTYQTKSGAITTANIGSQSVNYANSAGSATDNTKLPLTGGTLTNTLNIKPASQGSWTEGIRLYPIGNWTTIVLGGNDLGETGTSPNSWSLHSRLGDFYLTKNGSTTGTAQLACINNAWTLNDNSIITSGNIGSQSVNYANSAGSATKATQDGNGNNIVNTYQTKLGYNFVSGSSGTGIHDCNAAAAMNGHLYYQSNGPSASIGAHNDGALYVQSYSDQWAAQIAQDYRNGRLFVRGKNNGNWEPWLRVLDSTTVNRVEYVSSLPASPDPNTIYLIP